MATAHENRSSLPIPDLERPHLTPYDAKDAESAHPPVERLRPPAGAPNVLVVLLDDAGYGSSSVFGGPCQTPNFQKLADRGLRYTKFHTTALCSPTRAALLSGRNHHTVNMGAITEIATSAPGMTSMRPNTCAPLAETLRLNGYATAQIGKCHEIPVWETSPIGPFDRWPNHGGGFEYFWGFLGGQSDQYYPTLYENTTPVKPKALPEDGYTLNEEMADKAIGFLQRKASLAPDRPFFLYYAPGATHSPHQVPAEWSDKYRGRFDAGWDALREETLARQIALGVVPADTVLTERSEGLPAWEETREEMRPVLARQMEIYAGFMEQTDHHVGRILDELEQQGILDDTLVFVMVGDNGASAEGSLQGSLNDMIAMNGMEIETPERLRAAIDQLGTPESYNHYAAAWAHAMCAPFQWTKQVASHFGGTRNGMIVHWPAGISAEAGVREQFTHVIDVAATVLDVAGIPEPTTVNGVPQKPYEGTSLAYSFDDAAAPERHTTQYFEMLGNRGIYHNGWTAVTKHRIPWQTGGQALPAFDDDVWELYDTTQDWSQARDLSAEFPDKLHALQRLWLIEAVKHNVLPLDDRAAERGVAAVAGRPEPVAGNTQVLYSGMSLAEASAINTKNRSHAITAQIVVPDSGATGVIAAIGGNVGGWSLYAHEGRVRFAHNFFGLDTTVMTSDRELAPGAHALRIEFAYDGGGLGRGGTYTMFLDGEETAGMRVEHTTPAAYTASEGLDIGRDLGSAVSADYPPLDNDFTGTIDRVQIDVGELDPEHRVAEYHLQLFTGHAMQ
ncbi:MAG: arylsulfatase [Actinobacteria bacterium]|nr:arylsulfatase [Actinomycetota bacterium]